MSKSGVNTGFAKCFILFMAIVILVQGCLYLGLSIWGFTQQNCPDQPMDIAGNPFKSVIDLIYFISEFCGQSPSIVLPGTQRDVQLTVDWPKSYMVTNRLYIFIITYAAVSGLWIVASLLVIATICGPVTKLVSAVVFWPWFLVVIAGSMLDVVATGYHIHDILNTMSASDAFKYVGITEPNPTVMDALSSFDAYFITPAVVMTCVSSRVVIVSLLNIFGTSFCLSLSRVLSHLHNHHKHHKNHDRQNGNTNNTANMIRATTAPHNNNNNIAQTTAQNNPNAPRQENLAVEYVKMHNRPAPPVQASSQAQQHQQNQQMQRQSLRPPIQSPYSPPIAPTLTPDVVIVENANRQLPSDDTTYRKTDSHPDRLDYPPKTPTSPSQQSPISPSTTVQLSSASLLNNRYSNAEDFYTASANQQAGPPQRVTAELRSQLPWSYTSVLGGKPQPTRKPQVQVYPQIPEPDYNEELADSRASSLPTPANNNTNNNNNNEANLSQQQQQAYSRW